MAHNGATVWQATAADQTDSTPAIYQQSPHEVQQTSRLLPLPAELRNTIMEEVLNNRNSTIHIGSGYRLPNITATCRQLRTEALPIFFGRTELALDLDDFYPVKGFAGWPTGIAAHAHLIRHLHMYVCNTHMTSLYITITVQNGKYDAESYVDSGGCGLPAREDAFKRKVDALLCEIHPGSFTARDFVRIMDLMDRERDTFIDNIHAW